MASEYSLLCLYVEYNNNSVALHLFFFFIFPDNAGQQSCLDKLCNTMKCGMTSTRSCTYVDRLHSLGMLKLWTLIWIGSLVWVVSTSRLSIKSMYVLHWFHLLHSLSLKHWFIFTVALDGMGKCLYSKDEYRLSLYRLSRGSWKGECWSKFRAWRQLLL